MTRTYDVRRLAARTLLFAGLLALGYAGYVVVDARTYQAAERRRFEQPRQDVADATALTDGRAMGEIRIPRIGLTAIVAQGDSSSVLRYAVGHLAGSALPGETGNVVLAGHRDSFFRPLKDIRAGDVIAFKTLHGDFAYRVESTAVVSPNDVDVLEPRGGRTLTLVTCFPFFYVGPSRVSFIVHAREIETVR